jgi:Polyketide cyclase / dehydrase and lipid transport
VTSSRGCSGSPAVFAVAVLAGLYAATVSAADVYVAAASYEGDSYHVSVDAVVSAPLADVHSLLTDYDHLGRINPSIQDSEIVLQRQPGDLRVRTVTDVCVWIYCKRLRQVQDVTDAGDGSIVAIVIPEQSDFSYGYAHLSLWQEAAGTRVRLQGDLKPNFWIPPLIGPWLIKRKLIDEALVTISNLERVAPLPALTDNGRQTETP